MLYFILFGSFILLFLVACLGDVFFSSIVSPAPVSILVRGKNLAMTGMLTIEQLDFLHIPKTGGRESITTLGDSGSLLESEKNLTKADMLTIEQLDFLHIPKTGGESITALGDSQFGLKWGMDKIWGKKYQYALPCAPWHIPPHFFMKNPYQGKNVFCTFRDPYSRIISEFRYQLDLESFHVYHGIENFDCSSKSLNSWILAKLKPITKWNSRKVDLAPFWPVKAADRFKDHCHFLSQYEFIFDSNGVRTCHYVLQFKNLNQDFNKLKSIFNFNATLLQHMKPSITCPDLGIKDLNEISKNLIQNVYEEDIKIMNDENFPWFINQP